MTIIGFFYQLSSMKHHSKSYANFKRIQVATPWSLTTLRCMSGTEDIKVGEWFTLSANGHSYHPKVDAVMYPNSDYIIGTPDNRDDLTYSITTLFIFRLYTE